MKSFKEFTEKIVLDIKVGDTILGGRFKNKKTIVKKIGKNSKGDITINGKPLLKYRIIKENHIEKVVGDVDYYLASLVDDGFIINTNHGSHENSNRFSIRIWRSIDKTKNINEFDFNKADEFEYTEIENDLLRFIFEIEDMWYISFVSTIEKGRSFHRQEIDLDKFMKGYVQLGHKITSILINFRRKL